jgi:hypothetical protein
MSQTLGSMLSNAPLPAGGGLTQQDLDAAVATKANVVHTHAQADVTGLAASLAAKAPSAHTHATSEVTGLDNALLAKASASDPRFTDARTPTAHKTTHQHGGADEVGTSTPAANAIPKAAASGALAAGWLGTGVADSTKFLRGDGSWQVPPTGAAAGWTTISKAADQTVANSATLTDDTALQFAMAANAKYRIRARIFWDTTAAADFKFTFIGPASPTLYRAELVAPIAGAAPAWAAVATAYPAAAGVALVGTGTTGGFIVFEAIIHNGANAGAFKFQFAQNTATADTGAIVRAGSYLEWATA